MKMVAIGIKFPKALLVYKEHCKITPVLRGRPGPKRYLPSFIAMWFLRFRDQPVSEWVLTLASIRID